VAKPTRIIDIHQHVRWHGRDENALLANMDEQGIERSVLLNWAVTQLEQHCRQAEEAVFNPVHATPEGGPFALPLADIVEVASKYPQRFWVGYSPHPLDPYAVEHLDAAVRMYDVKVCGELKATICLDDPRCLNLLRYCGEKGLPVLFHMETPYRPKSPGGKPEYCVGWYSGEPDNVARALAACPETTFLAHGPGFWRHISGNEATMVWPEGPVTPGGRALQLLEDYPNLYADLSAGSGLNALTRDAEFGPAFVLKYHDRLLFGRDNYTGDLHEHLQSLDLPEDATENIYHRNAEKLLRGRGI